MFRGVEIRGLGLEFVEYNTFICERGLTCHRIASGTFVVKYGITSLIHATLNHGRKHIVDCAIISYVHAHILYVHNVYIFVREDS